MCLFKTIIGGWATTHRMHEPTKLNCIFSCKDEQDDIRHYVVCSPLWQIVGEVLSMQSPLSLAERLCLCNGAPIAVLRIALAFHCYHYSKALCTGENPQVPDLCARVIQRAAFESGLTFFRHLS